MPCAGGIGAFGRCLQYGSFPSGSHAHRAGILSLQGLAVRSVERAHGGRLAVGSGQSPLHADTSRSVSPLQNHPCSSAPFGPPVRILPCVVMSAVAALLQGKSASPSIRTKGIGLAKEGDRPIAIPRGPGTLAVYPLFQSSGDYQRRARPTRPANCRPLRLQGSIRSSRVSAGIRAR